ncbi:cobalamin synthesis protein P47K [Methylobacterium sp. 4-46]|uniref:CobW family GTP-binding protein n=1 Tax=unclassified Methylobacterium TaxID=2615210 RepID=UPI000165CBA3|nr:MULTISPECIES: GTP-binding protein [Methylobacterium]ACA19938.1 cobalamin synthesis protein P47K [Methylobacterium sp. 4-46]WFT79124.1 GTP-binding protein [Methylobacterium nodulans]
MVALPEPMPLFVLTGFLGSGKTTLLGRILRADAEARTGVLINEYGQAGLDHRIVAHVAEASAVVANGCLCCSVRPELARALLDLLRRSLAGEVPRFERVVLETSGLSDPAPIINTVQTHPVLKEYFRVAGVIATVDAVNGLASADDHAEFAKQVAVADLVLVTKSDLAAPAAARGLAERIRVINALAPVRDARAPDLDPASLLREQPVSRVSAVSADAAPSHAVSTFSISLDERLDWSSFVTWLSLLLNRHGRSVLRFKGMLNLTDESAPVLVHGVQHIMHPPEHMEGWPDDDRRSHLVFIARGLDPAEIRASLASFLRFARENMAPRPGLLVAEEV